MEGITQASIRSLYLDRGGLGLVCTEFVRISRAPLVPAQLEREVMRDPRAKLSVQVMGNEAEKMAEAARVLEDAGADIIDVNMGCPMPRVVRKGVGAAMLKDPELAARVVGMMRAATRGKLSVKIRAGYDDAEGIVELARRLEAEGIDFLTVHPRRRADFYRGVSDWRIVRKLASELRVPVIGNGDVFSASDALRLKEEAGVAGVMIGRPALRNPFIFQQIEALERGEEPIRPAGDDLLGHVDRLLEVLSGEGSDRRKRGPLGPMKEMVRYLLRADPRRDEYEREVLRSESVPELMSVLERELRGRSHEELDLEATPKFELERAPSAFDLEDAA